MAVFSVKRLYIFYRDVWHREEQQLAVGPVSAA